jgi:hypothetical protein
MKIPVTPPLFALWAACATLFLVLLNSATWPLYVVAVVNFLYAVNREIWHNGQPLVLRHRK